MSSKLLKRSQKSLQGKKSEILKNISLNNIEVQCEFINKEPVDSFILRLMREKYRSMIIGQSIDWTNNHHALYIRLQIDVKEILFKFTLTDSHIPFQRLKSDVYSVNIEIGILDSIEKYNLVENEFFTKIKIDTKGIKNEERAIDIARHFAEKENLKLIHNDILDNKGIDFMLIDKLKRRFPFQVKSSWSGVHNAVKKGKIFYYHQGKKIPIIFLIVSKKRRNRHIYNIIGFEIKKQINKDAIFNKEFV